MKNPLTSPRLLALGLPLALLSQCAPQQCAPATGPAAITVTRVIDGDTIDVSTGERVRLIGMDAPEAGACGAMEATNALNVLIGGQAVALTAGARDDRDRYGRLLRYVETAGVDAGRTMIEQGYAVARYDSRDGFGGHPREADYVALDAATGNACSTASPAVPPPPAGSCERAYPDFCLPPGVDVDCGEIPYRNFTVLAPDPFRLDGNDNDGRGCES